MKKIVSKEIKEHMKYVYYCDICGKEMKYHRYCIICGKDICSDCIEHEECIGDYSDYTCKNCWEIGTEQREKISKLEDEIEKLREEWYVNCRK